MRYNANPLLRACPAVACLALLLSGCADTPTAVKALPPHGVLEPMAYVETDTWMHAEISMTSSSTIVSDVAFPDPLTQQMTTSMSVSAPVEEMVLAGGYDAGGNFVGNLTATLDPDPAADPATQVAETRFNGDQVTNYNGNGQPMSPTLPDGSTVPNLVPEEMFNTGGDLLGGTVLEGPDAGGLVDNTAVLMNGAQGDGQVRRHVDQPDPSTLVVVDDVLDEPVATPQAGISRSVSPAEGGGRTRVARTFKRHGNDFVLSTVQVDRDERGEGGSAHHRQVIRYKKLSWHRNRGRDRARMQLASLAPAPVLPSRNMLAIGAPADAGTAVPTAQPGAPVGPGAPPLAYAVGGTGKRLVFQHGFAQNANYYNASPAVAEVGRTLRFDGAFVTATDYGARFEDQARQAISQMPQAPSIFVGHSNGGIVARQVARYRPDLVQGIITVSSPHHGVPLLRVGAVLGNLLSPVVFTINTVGCKWFRADGVCGLFDNGSSAIFSRIVGGDGRPVPVWDQEKWDEPIIGEYLRNLNSAPESFTRVGIEQHPRQKWLMFRVHADLRSGCGVSPQYPYGYPCGRDRVAYLDHWFGGLRAAAVVHWTWNPIKLAARVVRAAAAAVVMTAVTVLDAAFTRLVGVGREHDGLVPYFSQQYPNQSGSPVVIPNADSHNASAYSPPAVLALRQTLNGRFGLQPQ